LFEVILIEKKLPGAHRKECPRRNQRNTERWLQIFAEKKENRYFNATMDW
jgi:hypothetical protein